MVRTGRSASTLILAVLVLFVFLFVFFMYTFLHEGGHAIAGLLFGQSLTEFDVSFWDLSAHVGMNGEELTQTQLAIRAVAGAALPLLIWTIFISLMPRKANFVGEILKLLSSMTVVNTLLVWIVLPVLYLLGNAPSDDVTNFLRYSQMPPLLLVGIAILLYVGGWMLFLSKLDGLRNAFLLFGATDAEKLLQGAGKTVPVMAGLMGICLITAFVLNGPGGQSTLAPLLPPPGFEHVTDIDLATQPYSAEVLAEFTLDEPVIVGVFIGVWDINTSYFDLRLTELDGFSSTVLHGEGYNAEQDGGLWEQNLQPGTYRVVLTSHQSPGSVSIYLKTH